LASLDKLRRAEAYVRAMPGHTIAEMEPPEAARLRERIAPVVDEWVKRTPDGAAVLAAYRAEIAKIRGVRDRERQHAQHERLFFVHLPP